MLLTVYTEGRHFLGTQYLCARAWDAQRNI